MRPILLFGILFAAALSVCGCQPATRYMPPTEKVADKSPATTALSDNTLSPDLMWKDDRRQAPQNAVRLVFVHEDKDAASWDGLKTFWTTTTAPEAKVASALGTAAGLTPFPIVVAPDPQVVKIKVPRGLDDPTPFLPAGNPLTLPKWELGRDLFFDSSWLSANGKVSCAGCHMPDQGFTDGLRDHDGFNTPTLVNVVYNTTFFWDGRASCLEEVFARSLEDERATDKAGPFRHNWNGAVERLMSRDSKFWRRFEPVFATPPTQDAVGKALATYMRTLLSGDSLHDRALAEQARRKGKELVAGDYEKVFDDAALKSLRSEQRSKEEVAADLVHGYRLFDNLIAERKLNCVSCHSGRQFTDGKFHNVGVGDRAKMVQPPFSGHFAHVPIGQKDRNLIGAYKTPTLRNLLRTGPYFHYGEQQTLVEALGFHTQRFPWNNYLAPEMVEDGNPSKERYLNLSEKETTALLAFLRALNGTPVDAAVLPKRGR